jgi:hypothetical protein
VRGSTQHTTGHCPATFNLRMPQTQEAEPTKTVPVRLACLVVRASECSRRQLSMILPLATVLPQNFVVISCRATSI